MKKTIKELKNSARGSLLGHYGTVIAALLFSQLIVLLFNIPFNRMTQQGIYYMVPSRIDPHAQQQRHHAMACYAQIY